MSDTKKLAVVVSDRQAEALRMALGLVLADSAETVIQDQSEATDNEVTVFNVNQDKDYAKLVELIFASDKVFTW